MTDRELALRFMPHFYRDSREPFPVEAVGYSVLRADGKSPSSPRQLCLRGKAALMLEYAVFFDFDIQHLYDLEHVFLYLDDAGKVVGAEASFHGWFFNSMFPGSGLSWEEETHPIFYMQPGKHAMMPDPRLFYLYRELSDACTTLCGSGGFLVDPMFREELSTDPELDRIVEEYIRKHFAFEPSMHFEPAPLEPARLMTWPELRALIVRRMCRWSERLRQGEGERHG